jgi:hypothetical protein
MLKVALTGWNTKRYYIGNPELTKKIDESKEKYDNKSLETTINNACTQKVITKEEKMVLISLKDKFRNPYSHATISKIVDDVPPTFNGFMFSFAEVKHSLNNGLPIPQGKKTEMPSDILFQSLQYNKANHTALDYFTKIFTIMCEIEKRYDALKYTSH